MGNVLKSRGKRRKLEEGEEVQTVEPSALSEFHNRSVSLCVKRPKLNRVNYSGFGTISGLLTGT